MIDRNTYLHFGLAFIGALVLAMIFNEMWASFVMLALIIGWELFQAIVLTIRHKKLRWQSIVWDIGTGMFGTAIGCVIAVWIRGIV